MTSFSSPGRAGPVFRLDLRILPMADETNAGHSHAGKSISNKYSRYTIVGFWGDHQILPVSDRLARFDLIV